MAFHHLCSNYQHVYGLLQIIEGALCLNLITLVDVLMLILSHLVYGIKRILLKGEEKGYGNGRMFEIFIDFFRRYQLSSVS